LVGKIKAQQDAGLAVSDNWLYRKARLSETLDVIQKQLTAFSTRALDLVETRQGLEIRTAIKDSDAMFRAMVRDGATGKFKLLTQRAMADITAKMANGQPLRSHFASLGAQAVQSVESALIRGLAVHTPLREIAQDLRVEAGLPARSAMATARTAPLQAYREATRRNYVANGSTVRGWRWLAAKDANTCPMCLAMDGTEHRLDETLDTHIACRCTQVPLLFGRELDYGPTGKEWFANQTEEVQRKILGPSKLELYKNGHITLDDLIEDTHDPVWGAGRREATLQEVTSRIRQAPRLHVIEGGAGTPPLFPIRGSGDGGEEKKFVSEAIAFPKSGEAGKKAKEALDIVDSIHVDGDLPDAALRIVPASTKDYNGAFQPTFLGGPKFFLRNEGPTPMLTQIHETGHFLDFEYFGGGKGSAVHTSAEFEGFRTAVAESEEWQQLDLIKARLEAKNAAVGLTRTEIKIYKRVDYLLTPWELWARAYAQYIAVESGNDELLANLATIRQSGLGGQWGTEDFKEIRGEIDALIRSMGWK
jgi:SPP1 gp7 family putative phage head morphogenesis protein